MTQNLAVKLDLWTFLNVVCDVSAFFKKGSAIFPHKTWLYGKLKQVSQLVLFQKNLSFQIGFKGGNLKLTLRKYLVEKFTKSETGYSSLQVWKASLNFYVRFGYTMTPFIRPTYCIYVEYAWYSIQRGTYLTLSLINLLIIVWFPLNLPLLCLILNPILLQFYGSREIRAKLLK